MWSCSSHMSFGLVRDFPWRRRILVIFVQVAQFQCRLFLLVQALIFGVPVVLLVLLMRSLCLLLGGLRRFVPCSIGANHCRLRHIGWEKCGHGLTSRPRESASELFLNELLSLFRYPPRSGRALLNGTLFLQCCAVRFAHSTPTWWLPASGHVGRLVAAYPESAGDCGSEVLELGVHLVSRSGPVQKRFRLNRKTPAHLVGISAHSRPRVWKRLRQVGFSGLFMPDHAMRRNDHADGGSVHEHDRVGVG